MNTQQALDLLNERFVYQADRPGLVDRWHILSGDGPWRGDCEDYALTLMWLVSDRSWLKFWLALLTFRHVMWHVRVGPNRTGHALVKINGQWYDNIQQRPVSAELLESEGYHWSHPIIPPAVAVLMLITWIRKR
jgi:hypothetical protein